MATALFPLQRDMLTSYYSDLNNYDVKSSKLMREAALADTVEGKPVIKVLTDITPKYLKKIDDAYSLLGSISIDAQQIAEFFDSIKNGYLENFKEYIPLKDINSIGKLKPEYLKQVIQDMGKTIDDIMNKRKAMKDLMSYVKSNPASRIKRQMVSSINPIVDTMDYIKQQEKIPLTEINENTISRDVIPFLRSFDKIRASLYEENMSVKTTIGYVAAMLHKYSDTVESIKARGDLDAPTVDCLNYYLYNQYRIVEELISYITFSLVVKVDNYIFNVNAYNDLYRRVKTLTGENTPLQESVYEYSIAGIDLVNLSKRASEGDMTGVIDWTIRAYDAVISAYNHQNTTNSTIEFILDRFTNPNFVFDNVIHLMDQITNNIENIKPALRSAYVNPSALLLDSGLSDIEGVINEAKKISDTSLYEVKINNGNLPYSDMLFSIMAEMRQSPDKCEKLGEYVKKTYDKFEEFYKYIEDGSNIPNETAKNEMKQLFSNTMNQFDVFVKELVESIITRYQKLEKLCYKIMGMQGEVIECSDGIEYGRDFNVFSFESCIDLDNALALVMIESEMQMFKEMKLAKEYGLLLEGGEQNPQNTSDSGSDNSSGSDSPGSVQKDPSQQTETDKTQNTKASDDTNNKEDDKKKKDGKKDGFFKQILESINNFFTNMLNSFTKAVNARFLKDKDFIVKYKSQLLDRSYTGVTINMYNYDFNMTGQNMRNDITKINTVLSQVNETNVNKFAKGNLKEELFKGISLNEGITDIKNAVQLYYKIGAKSTEVTKTKYDTADSVKNLVSQMINFCESFCVNQEFKQMNTDIEKLKKALSDKVTDLEGKEFPEGKEEEYKNGLKKLDEMVMVFAGAVLTGYKNRFQHYMYILRKCVVDKEDVETPNNEQQEKTNNNANGGNN